ncbi:unnamed protein product [marine sediment metagenome]|uniref:Uncharacterized protein n=1 Tax=marine sediment metagenome TaxID=412755 RepID=X1KLX9_9ZZZZ
MPLDNPIMPEGSPVRLTVPMLQVLEATGTFGTTPEYVFDGDVLTTAKAHAIDEYAQVLFLSSIRIKQWRQSGESNQDMDGSWKIQYLDDNDAWVDWVTGIPTAADGFGSWANALAEVLAKGLRLVAVTMDARDGKNYIKQLEVS